MNNAYIGKLMELAEKDPNIVHLLADSGTGYDEMFRRNFPDQMFNFGIAEGNMVAAAAGMATAGKIPFVFTAGAFLAYRAMEYIRDDICFQNLNVKITGMGCGLSWSSLGPTHHTTEEISVLRSIPNLMLLSPASPNQVRACVEEAYRHEGPVYIRIGMNKEKEFFEEASRLPMDGFDEMTEGGDAILFSTGSILEEVMRACDDLGKQGVFIKVVNVPRLKPFGYEKAKELISGYDKVFTVEEHNVLGGLGSILSETISLSGMGKKLIPIGLNDCFAKGYGSIEAVRKENGLDAGSIGNRIKGVLQV
jgi:transketolase